MPAVRKTDEPEAGEWVSLTEAGRLLGESRPTVLHRTVKGQIVAKHVAGRTIVSRASIEQLLATRGA